VSAILLLTEFTVINGPSHAFLPEILLACLLSRFTFSLTKDEIVWNLSMIIAPSVKSPGSKEGETREEKGMPLFVRMVEQSA
jgi:hypothetical protein